MIPQNNSGGQGVSAFCQPLVCLLSFLRDFAEKMEKTEKKPTHASRLFAFFFTVR